MPTTSQIFTLAYFLGLFGFPMVGGQLVRGFGLDVMLLSLLSATALNAVLAPAAGKAQLIRLILGRSSHMLTEAQQSKWHKDGYLRLERFFDPATRDKISRYVEEVRPGCRRRMNELRCSPHRDPRADLKPE